MPKNILQDIKPLTHTSRKTVGPKVQKSEPEGILKEEQLSPSKGIPPYLADERRSRSPIWIVALASVVVLLFSLSFLFSGATVTVTPKTKEIELLSQTFA